MGGLHKSDALSIEDAICIEDALPLDEFLHSIATGGFRSAEEEYEFYSAHPIDFLVSGVFPEELRKTSLGRRIKAMLVFWTQIEFWCPLFNSRSESETAKFTERELMERFWSLNNDNFHYAKMWEKDGPPGSEDKEPFSANFSKEQIKEIAETGPVALNSIAHQSALISMRASLHWAACTQSDMTNGLDIDYEAAVNGNNSATMKTYCNSEGQLLVNLVKQDVEERQYSFKKLLQASAARAKQNPNYKADNIKGKLPNIYCRTMNQNISFKLII